MGAVFPRCCCADGELVIMGETYGSEIYWMSYVNGAFTRRVVTPSYPTYPYGESSGRYIDVTKRNGKPSPKIVTGNVNYNLRYYDWNPATGDWDDLPVKVNGKNIKGFPRAFCLDNNKCPRIVYIGKIDGDAYYAYHYLYRTIDGEWIDKELEDLSMTQRHLSSSLVDNNNEFWMVYHCDESGPSIRLLHESGNVTIVSTWGNASTPNIAYNNIGKFIAMGSVLQSDPYCHIHYPDGSVYKIPVYLSHTKLLIAQNKLWLLGRSAAGKLMAYSSPLGANNWAASTLGDHQQIGLPVCVDDKETIHLIQRPPGTIYDQYWQFNVNGGWKKIAETTGIADSDNVSMYYVK